ncbi:AAA family ATPase [Vibrio natriegens]|uniref:AAA family ATPase n=1 Tax=Vibrio natriegens TaxID=691 RepID=UPI001C3D04B3|nr:AAA family ATPase [Vibrio natriegens]
MRKIEEHNGIPLLIPSRVDYGENSYTIITGKNGVGKSRLISEIARKYTDKYVTDREEYLFHSIYKSFDHPKVIAVSTSPFDKFPLNTKRNNAYEISNYRYVGMRSNKVNLSSVSLISSAISGIFEQLTVGGGYERLIRVFEVLGFAPELQFVFKINLDVYHKERRYDLDRDNELHRILMGMDIPLDRKVIDSLEGLDLPMVHEIVEALSFITSLHNKNDIISMNVDFYSSKRISFNGDLFGDENIMKPISTLLKNNIIRIMDVKLDKNNFGPMSLRRASSGEQCMLVMMLGIAGHITDSSLILIDEPEISLHPKWQENFTSLLIDVFSEYKNCQFIIATHSPQIVSNLRASSCFITSITKRKVYPADKFSKQSSDFQLAELFDAPGNKNEYITRLSFSLLSKVKNQKCVYSEDKEQLRHLMNFLPDLRKDDAVYELIMTIKEVVGFYASN